MTLLFTSLLLALGSAGVVLMAVTVLVQCGVLPGFFLPGNGFLFAGGLLVATARIDLPLWLVAGVVTVSAVTGNELGYELGRRLGPKVFARRAMRWIKPHHLRHAETFFESHGAKAVVLARFVPVVRTLTPFLAGTHAMPRRSFLAHNVLGGVLWGAGLVVAGYFLGAVPFVQDHMDHLVTAFVAVTVVVLSAAVVLGAVRRRRVHAGQSAG